ncbi:hypothetical protein [Brevundimonas sp. LM2]|nr:hypothetical protein [Brevundimonas sp. LM2]
MTTPKPAPTPALRYSLVAAMARQTQAPAPERKSYSLVDAMRRLTQEGGQ